MREKHTYTHIRRELHIQRVRHREREREREREILGGLLVICLEVSAVLPW